ncbi:hypothetical protein [Treponema parvum]|uniref:hypothetical protein n=1 Tax=Treponema parvum TaxID=138851 RepID=UPI001AEBB592|nr:hypothetical protein [Treponema parvum]QTQ15688.1 hypothetical protein HXT04_02640 [Treponema parvum]
MEDDKITSGQKNAVSLLVAVFLFAAFAIAAFSGLFSAIETRFYQPAKVLGITRQLDDIAAGYDLYVNSLLGKLEAYTAEKPVASYLTQRASDEDVRERSRITGALFNSVPGLSGIRIIDSNGRSVHFSTYSADLLQNSENLRVYKNYGALSAPSGTQEIPFSRISVADGSVVADGSAEKYKITPDAANRRVIFSFPFYDVYTAYRGTAVFYLSSADFNRELSALNLITLSETGILLDFADGTASYGYVFGLPVAGRDFFEKQILERWKGNEKGPERIVSYEESGGRDGFETANDKNAGGAAGDEGGGVDGGSRSEIVRNENIDGKMTDGSKGSVGYWVLLSSKKSSFAVISGVYRDSIFVMPQTVRILLLVCVFISLFLAVFLLLSLKIDDMVVIQNRIRRFQFSVVNEYLNKKMDVDWSAVVKNIENRKDEVSKSIRKSLGHYRVKKYGKEVDELLNKSWEEIFAALNVRSGAAIAAEERNNALQNSAEIKQMLQEILGSGTIKIQAAAVQGAGAAGTGVSETAGGNGAGVEVKNFTALAGDPKPAESVAETENQIPGEIGKDEDLAVLEDAEDVEELEESGDDEDLDVAGDSAEAGEIEDLVAAEEAPGEEKLVAAEDVSEVEDFVAADDISDAEPVEELAAAAEVGENLAAAADVSGTEPSAGEEVFEAEPVEELKDADEVKLPAQAANDVKLPEAVKAAESEAAYVRPSGAAPSDHKEAEPTVETAAPSALEMRPDSGATPSAPEAAGQNEDKKSEFDEKPGFDSDAKENRVVSEGDVSDFQISSPDFDDLDDEMPRKEPDFTDTVADAYADPDTYTGDRPIDSEDTALVGGSAVSEADMPAEEVFPLEEILGSTSRPFVPDFSFTAFAARGNAPITEIAGAEEADKSLSESKDDNVADKNNAVIIAEDDGLFRISDDIRTEGTKIDPSFKKLVESVLK